LWKRRSEWRLALRAMKNSDDIRKRMEALNRGPLERRPGGKTSSAQEDLRRQLRRMREAKRPAKTEEPDSRISPRAILFQRDLPRHDAPKTAPSLRARPHVRLEEAVDCSEILAPDGARVFLIERRVTDCSGELAHLSAGLSEALERRASGLRRQLEYLGIAADWSPADIIFLDLETTGLSSSPLFLIGIMVVENQDLVVRQYFARDYSQERAAVSLFFQCAARHRLLVSFNGKSFDFPYVRIRAAANGLACPFDPAHLDLLHAARRIWRRKLPDCKLQTLETFICGRSRRGDIPGHLIPDAYHAYVRTGNAADMVQVLEHNFLDLVTMADLIVRMPDAGGL